MVSDFSRILSLLRKEKGISQKQAAKELEISQSLLSHYEKGIRECGLAFVVKAANFYNVSCDYLLGKSPEKHGTYITPSDLQDPTQQKEAVTSQMFKIVYRKKILMCSINIVLNLLANAKNNELIDEIFNFFYLAAYKMFRVLFKINKKNNKEMLAIDESIANKLALAEMIKNECLANKIAETSTDENNFFQINNQTLAKNHPADYNALLNLIKNCEVNLKNKFNSD